MTLHDTPHTLFLASETQSPETPFEEHKFRVSYRCQQCGHQWKSRWLRTIPKRDPPCPNPSCVEVTRLRQTEEENRRLRTMLEEQKAPAQIGASNLVKAVDMAAEMTMKDYGMTDLKDNVRAGETVAPKLDPSKQALADSMFGGTRDAKVRDVMTGQMRNVQAEQLNRIGKRAIAGRYRGLSVSPISVIPENMRNKPPLQLVRTEKVK